jgi:hypothetical protein
LRLLGLREGGAIWGLPRRSTHEKASPKAPSADLYPNPASKLGKLFIFVFCHIYIFYHHIIYN